MQNRHDRTLIESVMLCPTYQTSWVMENLRDRSGTLPDPDIFAVHINEVQGFGGLDKFFEFVHFFEDNNPGTRSMAASAKKDKKVEKDKSNYWDAVNFWNSFLTAPGPFQMLANGQIVPHPQISNAKVYGSSGNYL